MAARIVSTTVRYEGWARLSQARVRLDSGQEITREIEDHGASVAVLPYDPVRRTALLVRQVRAPVLATLGASDLLEAPAGLTDGGDPIDTARRELHEEVGLALTELEHVASVFTMPGISTEHMDLYLARYTPADRTGAGGGLADEHEQLTVEELALAELWRMAERNELADMKTLTLLFALRLRHGDLFR